jgi:hypothetical protein
MIPMEFPLQVFGLWTIGRAWQKPQESQGLEEEEIKNEKHHEKSSNGERPIDREICKDESM